MFGIKLSEYKDVLSHLVKVSPNLIFAEGVICSINKQRTCFAMLEYEEVDINNPISCDCSVLRDRILKSREINEMTFMPEKNRIVISKPYKFKPTIKEVAREESNIEAALFRVDVIDKLFELSKNENYTYKTSRGENHNFVPFQVSNAIFRDMLTQIGKTDRLELTCGEKELILTNHTSSDIIKYPGIGSEREISILITESCQPNLLSSLLTEDVEQMEEKPEKDTSLIFVADVAFIVVVNKCKTLIHSGMGRK